MLVFRESEKKKEIVLSCVNNGCFSCPIGRSHPLMSLFFHLRFRWKTIDLVPPLYSFVVMQRNAIGFDQNWLFYFFWFSTIVKFFFCFASSKPRV